MDQLITVKTELFNYRDAKQHFINPCCFGEDFAMWLKKKLSPLEGSGYKLSEIIQEDYGWGFWARAGKDPFWVAISCIGSGPEEYDGEWGVSVSYDPGLNLLKRLFHRPNRGAFDLLRTQVRQALESEPAIISLVN